MRAAVVRDDVVVNVIEVEDIDAFEIPGAVLRASEEAGIDWTWSGEGFVPPPAAEPGIPQTVTMRQAKLTLLAAGILDDADAAIQAMEGMNGRIAQIEWATATELRRDHPLVAGLGVTLGLDDAAIDALFIQAAQIP